MHAQLFESAEYHLLYITFLNHLFRMTDMFNSYLHTYLLFKTYISELSKQKMVLFPQGFNVGTTYFQSQNTSKDLYYQTVEGDAKNDTKAFCF